MSHKLINYGAWTLIQHKEEWAAFCSTFPGLYIDEQQEHQPKRFPCFAQIHVSGACDNNFSFVVLDRGELSLMDAALASTERLLELWRKNQ